MTAKNKAAKKCLANKQDKLNWSEFNFLENLLIFCALPERVVPKESGIHFRITLDQKSGNKEVCILFKIDRKNDPLLQGDSQKRPDYLCFYVSEDACILTIIEMKGKNHAADSIAQMNNLKERLKQEIEGYFPKKLKIKYQGILLMSHLDQSADQLIVKEAKKGFIILPLEYTNKFELYNYISRINTFNIGQKERYTHQKIQESESLLIETILTRKALPKRLSNYSEIDRKTQIYIDYLHEDDLTLITLVANNNQIEVRLSSNNNQEQLQKIIKRLQKDLEGLKLPKISYNT